MAVKWQEMTGEERYKVVELARQGEQTVKDICETFGVSRQTLYRAMEKAEQAAKGALEPKKPGRRGKSEEEQRIIELSKQQSSLEQEVEHWKKRYEVAQRFIDLQRKQEERERARERARQQKERGRRKKKQQGSGRRSSGKVLARRETPWLAVVDDGADAGDQDGEPEELDEEA